jgi:gamma-glutamylcyclotransferase (GGCT)/AIG2-like uncharacterized protein YtfP
MNKFFVYGTLKMGGYFAEQFNSRREYSKVAILHKYDLFAVGKIPTQFPGIVPGEGSVIGELHEFPQNQVISVTMEMDMIEGYSGRDEYNSLYLRKIAVIELEDGSFTGANIYEFNGPIEKQYKKIESGIWEI